MSGSATVTASYNFNLSAGSTSNNLNAFTFSNSNGVSFGLNGSVVTASGGYVLSTYEPYPIDVSGTAALSAQTATSNSASFFPFPVNESVSAGFLDLIASLNFITMGTSSGQQSATHAMALYSRGTGTNSTTIGTVVSTSFGLSVTYNNSTISVAQATTTNYTGYATGSTSSGGTNIVAGYSGLYRVQFPVNTLLPPGQYWLGLFARESTSSNSGGIKLSWIGTQMTLTALKPIGSSSSAFTSGTNLVGMQGNNWIVGFGVNTAATTTLPVSVALSQFTNNLTVMPYMKFVST